MKLFGTILLSSASLLTVQAAEDAKPAEETNVVVVSSDYINRLAEEARTNNPSLRAAGSRVNAAELNAGAVRTWEDPMAMVGGSVFSGRGFDPAEEGDLAYGIEQKLPLWGKPKATRKVAETDVSMRRAEAELRFHELRRDITKSLLMTALAERVVEIGEQDLAWLDATAKTVEARYRAGQAVIADTLQIQNELAKRNDMLRTDRRRLAHEHLALNRLLNRDVNSPWPHLQLPEAVPAVQFSEKLVSLGLASEPRLKVTEQEIKQAEAMAELTRKMRLPDVSFGVEGKQYHGDGEFRMGLFKLGISLPWGNAGKYKKDYLREKERQKAAEEERRDQILMVREQLHHLTVEIEAFRREALLYRDEITTRATQALSNRLTDWETGRGTFRDVLDARRMLLESQLMSARAVAEQRQMVAELLLWTGLNSAEALTPLATEPSITPDHDNR
ncbi:MAG: TolC family protein [Verrucomicrobiales bacterium]|nr:TolC family protein [Verrucomicrobiales bacterium]